ncbi:hypothetical protein BGZ83_006588 [Gryganskiella cystojenkinii]|nr:hypothetical protein BGZ83_006588 [Gryganskiella cystojenkinii]
MDLPSSKSAITIREIDLDNWEKVSDLIVNKDQVDLLCSNLKSLCEHQFCIPQSVVRAVYAEDTPVGYIRLQSSSSLLPEHDMGNYKLLSFMIDQRCQGLGFGTKAFEALKLDAVVAQGCKSIRVSTSTFSTVREDDSPAHFFATLGFTQGDSSSELIWTP